MRRCSPKPSSFTWGAHGANGGAIHGLARWAQRRQGGSAPPAPLRRQQGLASSLISYLPGAEKVLGVVCVPPYCPMRALRSSLQRSSDSELGLPFLPDSGGRPCRLALIFSSHRFFCNPVAPVSMSSLGELSASVSCACHRPQHGPGQTRGPAD